MIAFDSGNCLAIPDSTAIRSPGMSISIWFNINAPPPPSQWTLICRPQTGPPWTSPYLSYFIVLASSTTIEADFGGTATYSAKVWTVPTITLNTWHNVTISYNGAALTSFFYDGSGVGIETAFAQPINYVNGMPTLIGANFGTKPYGGVIGSGCLISDVKIWSRPLTSGEVSIIYASRSKNNNVPLGLIAHWPLNEGADGTTVSYIQDRTSFNNCGVVTGSGAANRLTYQADNFLQYGYG